ncbi:uncharacterized protein HMPREF1541_10047 [Cyphellophora europaea CBS 101466]|uniref:DNA ligase n=1 Tax=Cyphellophora europaea (strain CBS 101466) TaxID=1220924 RepID=W2S946_CYPE1|nr:uncharacterized protein HMPREF1541_10047 [Cyphellophora europaea CBS 101466]ETN45170.1 hypothetical protein HMPREF1541_10047 [Cyphellophora europaea CBS 101466]
MDVDNRSSSQAQPSQPVIDTAARELEFDQKYPNRPRNKQSTLPFHSLYQDLCNPLLENRKKPPGQVQNRRKLGPQNGLALGSHEKRRAIIERYISRWRREVGPDFFPAMRLLLPEKDRDRAMYGLKEKALGKYLVKIMKIDKNSEDGFSLLNWKVPGKHTTSAGDFATRCYEVIQKRPFRDKPGNMTVQEVNDELDNLSAAQKEENQLPIITKFYRNMNAEELMWLVRIILRQMKVGASEKTILEIFHPDADALFNVSSSLRRVCWELYDEHIRLETEHKGVTLMQCFQPQLAQFTSGNFQKMVDHLRRYSTEEDKEFWIEEKLDGERMQMHVQKDAAKAGGFNFKFYSRKAKDYTYLYGDTLDNKNSALTQHLKDAFRDGIEDAILDGEMITWDPEQDRQAAFGTLKSAAISEQNNPFTDRERPLFRVFDMLLLNGKLLTPYTLRDRRRALEQAIKPVHRRFELHPHTIGVEADDIDPHLREAIETASEGLVLKNPRSLYTLADRNNDWIKVKPEYMQNYGESLDCLIIGGYYGSGKRGGFLSSFLCGLRSDKTSQQFISFFKVGGGMTANDYAAIQYATEGKWIDWNIKKPPTQYVKLAGPELNPRERPDQWIKPHDSIVVEAKAASVTTSDEFAAKLTLRFPRFKKIRRDRSWENSLTLEEFQNLKAQVEEKEEEQKKFKAEERSNKRTNRTKKRALQVVGGYDDSVKIDIDAVMSNVFHGLTFFVATEALKPQKKSKPQLEELIKKHGGKVVQTNHLRDDSVTVYTIADRRNVKVASLEKAGDTLLIRPQWLLDCIQQAKRDFNMGMDERALPWESERHLFFIPEKYREDEPFEWNIDKYGDPYYRDTGVEELRDVFKKMTSPDSLPNTAAENLIGNELDDASDMRGWMFRGCHILFDSQDAQKDIANEASPLTLELTMACTTATFAGATLATDIQDSGLTHIVVSPRSDLKALRKKIASKRRQKIPRLVVPAWIAESWESETLLDDERFAP